MPKKVHEIHDAIVRENPGIDDSRAWAMAWATYKKMKKEMLKELFISPNDLKSMNQYEKNRQMLRLAIIAEQDASNLYDQFAEMTDNPEIKKTMQSVSKEEKTHVGEFQALLKKIDPQYANELIAGEQETKEGFKLEETLKKVRDANPFEKCVVCGAPADEVWTDGYKTRPFCYDHIPTRKFESDNMKLAKKEFSNTSGVEFKKGDRVVGPKGDKGTIVELIEPNTALIQWDDGSKNVAVLSFMKKEMLNAGKISKDEYNQAMKDLRDDWDAAEIDDKTAAEEMSRLKEEFRDGARVIYIPLNAKGWIYGVNSDGTYDVRLKSGDTIRSVPEHKLELRKEAVGDNFRVGDTVRTVTGKKAKIVKVAKDEPHPFKRNVYFLDDGSKVYDYEIEKESLKEGIPAWLQSWKKLTPQQLDRRLKDITVAGLRSTIKDITNKYTDAQLKDYTPAGLRNILKDLIMGESYSESLKIGQNVFIESKKVWGKVIRLNGNEALVDAGWAGKIVVPRFREAFHNGQIVKVNYPHDPKDGKIGLIIGHSSDGYEVKFDNGDFGIFDEDELVPAGKEKFMITDAAGRRVTIAPEEFEKREDAIKRIKDLHAKGLGPFYVAKI